MRYFKSDSMEQFPVPISPPTARLAFRSRSSSTTRQSTKTAGPAWYLFQSLMSRTSKTSLGKPFSSSLIRTSPSFESCHPSSSNRLSICSNSAPPPVPTSPLHTHHCVWLSATRRRPTTYSSFVSFFSSRCFTILPTSCERSRVVISSASSVSTTTRSFTPTAATNFRGA